MDYRFQINLRTSKPIYKRLVFIIYLFSSTITVAAIPVHTHPPSFKVSNSSSSGVSFPNIPFICEGESIQAVYDCADQIREYNIGNTVLSIVSMTSDPNTIFWWDVEYIPLDDPDAVETGHFSFNIERICEEGYKKWFTPAPEGKPYCEPIEKDNKMCSVGNPVTILKGVKTELETDYRGNGPFPIVFNRYYNSSADSITQRLDVPNEGTVGARWNHQYSGRLSGSMDKWFQYESVFTPNLEAYYTSDSDLLTLRATVHRPDGSIYQFTNRYNPFDDCRDFSEWVSREPGAVGKLADVDRCAINTPLVYTTLDNIKEYYDTDGLLYRVVHPSGVVHSIIRDPDTNQITNIIHSTGESLTLNYVSLKLDTVTDGNGRTWSYRYDGNNLEYVDNPDDTTRQYHYSFAYSGALTGITDERSLRYANFEYGGVEGKAIASYHGQITPVLTERIEGVSIDDDYFAITNRLTNSNGDNTDYSYTIIDGFKFLNTITGPGCVTCGTTGIVFGYDGDKNISSINENGLLTTFNSYTPDNFVQSLTIADGAAEQKTIGYFYDSRFINKISNIIEPSVSGGSKQTIIDYDNFANITSITVNGYKPDATPVTRSQSFAYNGPYNQLTQIDGPRTDVADITDITYYDDLPGEGDNRARMSSVTAPLGIVLAQVIQWTATGKIDSYDAANNLHVDFTYYPGNDRLEKLIQEDMTTMEQRVIRWTYLPTGEVKTITQGYGTTDATTITFKYDQARRLTYIYDGPNDGTSNYIKFTLDTENNIELEEIYDENDVLRKSLNQTFDAYSRLDVLSQENENLDPTFAPDGTLDLVVDGNNTTMDFSYDALRRLTKIEQDKGGTDPTTQDATTDIDYDVQDNLTSVTDPINGNTIYEYDDLGNLLSQTSPDTGTTVFTHDDAGNIKTSLDARYQLVTYSYDALNRLTGVDAPGSDDDYTYVYDSCYNGVGRLCRIDSVGGSVHYTYNAFGDVTSQQAVEYSYDAAGHIKTITYPTGAVVTYGYDSAGQVSSVDLTRNGSTVPLASGIQYLPFGDITGLNYGNGLSLTQNFDYAYRMTSQTIPGIHELVYPLYDANGNLKQRDDSVTPTNNSTFSYDRLDRLDLASDAFGARDYDYDKNGNRTSLDDGAVTMYDYDINSNRMNQNGASMVILDDNGNTVTDGNRTYSYTTHNRLYQVFDNGVLKATYSYNGLGQRISKQLPDGTGKRYIYGLDGKLLAETDLNGNVLNEYVYLNDNLLAMYHADSDADGETNVREDAAGTNPVSVDSDGDGLSDNDEIFIYGTSPLLADSDGDGIDDGVEIALGSDPLNSSITLGDINLDAAINLGDYVLLIQFVLNTRTPTPTEQAQADLDQDGQLTLKDMLKMQRVLLGLGIASIDQLLDAVPALFASLYDLLIPEAYAIPGDGEIYYVHNDHLGTPKAMTSESGMKVWSASHDPFGKATVDEDVDGDGLTVTLNHRFPGQTFDAESGLHYNYFRTYDPEKGRYLTADPIGLAGGLNLYLYVGGNPVNSSDQYGLFVDAMGMYGSYTAPSLGFIDKKMREAGNAIGNVSNCIFLEFFVSEAASFLALTGFGELSGALFDKVGGKSAGNSARKSIKALGPVSISISVINTVSCINDALETDAPDSQVCN